jgi:DNA polymerase I
MSHSAPNLAQVSKDHRARECWIPRPGWKLVGVDAEGLEARMLAHYMHRYDDGAFTKMLLEGRKEDATDVHSANSKAVNAVGFPVDREGAKTLLYALMYGAGDPKLGMTVMDRLRALGLPKPKLPPRELGALVRLALSRSMKGIDKLTADILQAIKTKKHLRGLDGRHVAVRSTHSALNTLLQGAGAIVMKQALADFFEKHPSADYGLCAAVHDEQQIEAHPSIAATLGQSFADCIRLAGEHFSLKCPLAGKAAVGDNWSETH